MVEFVLLNDHLFGWSDLVPNGRNIFWGTDISRKCEAERDIATDIDASMFLFIPMTLRKP